MNLNEPQTCYVAGWGKTSDHSTVHELRMVNVSIIDPQICERMWDYALPSNVICAGGYNTNKGFCQVGLFEYDWSEHRVLNFQ